MSDHVAPLDEAAEHANELVEAAGFRDEAEWFSAAAALSDDPDVVAAMERTAADMTALAEAVLAGPTFYGTWPMDPRRGAA